MKKLGLLVMPLMAVSLLASCGGSNPEPFPESTYTITFKNDGDPDKKIENIKAGSIVEEIPDPTTPKPDSTFIGWCTDTDSNNVFDFSTIKIYQNYTLYSGWEPIVPPSPQTVERTVSFNIPDCKMYYGDTEIKSSGTKIEIPDVNPYYVKFEVTSNTYKKPSKVTLDKTTDYAFDDDSGNLIINLQTNLNVTGTCDIYKTLEECTWSQIADALEAGEAEHMFNIGEEKTVVLLQDGVEQGFSHTVRIIGFNHDYSELPDDGGDPDPSEALGITFEFKNLITKGTATPAGAYVTKWNANYNYDYRSSILNNALNDETDDASVINRLPKDLRDVIKPVDKKVGVNEEEIYGGNYTALSFDDTEHPFPYLFALAHDEMTSNKDVSVTENEGNIYEYYETHTQSEYIIKSTVNGDIEYYWLRSPNAELNDTAYNVRWNMASMFSGIGRVNDGYAVAPAFCI